jgi:hypothetical protein
MRSIRILNKSSLWLPRRINAATLKTLRAHCGHLHSTTSPARFDYGYIHRLSFTQPKDFVLEWIAEQDDALINFLEITLDFTYKNWAARDDAWYFLNEHATQPWQGSQRVFIDHREKKTHYQRNPSARTNLVFYQEEHSRITGECHCLHLEMRLKGLRAVRSAGILSGYDLVNFDHRGFWKQRLRLYDMVDEARLGRYVSNVAKKTKRRQFNPLDARHGHVIRGSVLTMQELIDEYGHMRIQRVMQRMSNDPFLPPATHLSSIPGRHAHSHPVPIPALSNPEMPNMSWNENID